MVYTCPCCKKEIEQRDDMWPCNTCKRRICEECDVYALCFGFDTAECSQCFRKKHPKNRNTNNSVHDQPKDVVSNIPYKIVKVSYDPSVGGFKLPSNMVFNLSRSYISGV